MITAKVIKKKEKETEAQKFADYFDVCEPLKHCSSHRLLAMRRGKMQEYCAFLSVLILKKPQQNLSVGTYMAQERVRRIC